MQLSLSVTLWWFNALRGIFHLSRQILSTKLSPKKSGKMIFLKEKLHPPRVNLQASPLVISPDSVLSSVSAYSCDMLSPFTNYYA